MRYSLGPKRQPAFATPSLLLTAIKHAWATNIELYRPDNERQELQTAATHLDSEEQTGASGNATASHATAMACGP